MATLPTYLMHFTDPTKAAFAIPPYTTDGPVSPSAIQNITQNTSLRLYGKGTANYGEKFQENLVRVMENFAGPTPPENAIAGQLWFAETAFYRDTAGAVNNKYFAWNGASWTALNTTNPSPDLQEVIALPATLVPGRYYFNTSTLVWYQAHVFDSDASITTVRELEYVDGDVAPTDDARYELRSFDGATWDKATGSTVWVDPSAPPFPRTGDLWFDGLQLYVYTGAGSPGWLGLIPTTSNFVLRTGDTMTGNLNMGGNEVLGLPASPSATGATSKEYVDGLFGLVVGSPFLLDSDDVSNSSGVVGATVTNALDTLDGAVLKLAGGTMAGNIDMGGNTITGLPTGSPLTFPSVDSDVTTKIYVDQLVVALDSDDIANVSAVQLGSPLLPLLTVSDALKYLNIQHTAFVAKTGDEMEGDLLMVEDAEIFAPMPGTGGSPFDSGGSPIGYTSPFSLVNKGYVDALAVHDHTAGEIDYPGDDVPASGSVLTQYATPTPTNVREAIDTLDRVVALRTSPDRTLYVSVPQFTIVANSSTYFDVTPTIVDYFQPGFRFEVSGSTGSPSNDGTYTVISAETVLGSPGLVVRVTVSSIPNASANDGAIDMLSFASPRFPMGTYKSQVYVNGQKFYTGDHASQQVVFDDTLDTGALSGLLQSRAEAGFEWATSITSSTGITIGAGSYSADFTVDGETNTITLVLGSPAPTTMGDILGLINTELQVFSTPTTAGEVAGIIENGKMYFHGLNRGSVETFTITDVDPSAKTVTVSGDASRLISGRVFQIGSSASGSPGFNNDGLWTSAGVVPVGSPVTSTVVSVAGSPTGLVNSDVGVLYELTSVDISDTDLFSNVLVGSPGTPTQLPSLHGKDDTDPTFLNTPWEFRLTINGTPRDVDVQGRDAATYGALIGAINDAILVAVGSPVTDTAVVEYRGDRLVFFTDIVGTGTFLALVDGDSGDPNAPDDAHRLFHFLEDANVFPASTSGFDGTYVEIGNGYNQPCTVIEFVTPVTATSDIEIISYGESGLFE